MPDEAPRSQQARAAAERALVRVVHHYGSRPEFVSPLGEARVRFNAAMAKVQATSDREAKAVALEEYLQNESEERYIEAAQEMISEFRTCS